MCSSDLKLGVAAVFLALFLGGALSFNSVKREAGFEPIFDTEDSTIIRWQYAAYRHYGDAYTWNVTLVLASPDIEYSDAAARARIGEAVAAAGASEFVDGGSVDSWLDMYVAEVAPTAAAFYPSLRSWLASPSGRRFANDVELSDDDRTRVGVRPKNLRGKPTPGGVLRTSAVDGASGSANLYEVA